VRNVAERILKSITEFWNKLSRSERIRLIVLAVVIIGLAILVATLLGRTTYATLYSGDSAEAGEIILQLEDMGVTYRPEGAGTILIPEEQLSQVRMQLANLGYPSKGGFPTTLEGAATGLGVTDFTLRRQDIQLQEVKIRQQIEGMTMIKSCLVQLYIPDESTFVFPDEKEQPSAAVTLELMSGATLDQQAVELIANTVSKASGIPVENISMGDYDGRLYTVGGEDYNTSGMVQEQIDLEKQVSDRMRDQIIAMLEAIYGTGKVRVSVEAALQFDEVLEESVVFEPPVEGSEEGLAVSMQRMYEYQTDAAAEGEVGTDVNGVAMPEYPWGTDEGFDYRHFEETFNYELNETKKQIQAAKGSVKSLNVAVILDSNAVEADYTENVRSLVVNAINVNEDNVTVERMPFMPDTTLEDIRREQDIALRNGNA
jgi:flagellar M-ring protein FliF